MSANSRAESATATVESRDRYALDVRGVAHAFTSPTQGSVLAVRDATFSVRRGSFVSLVGPSGCGKTTVLNLITGLEPVQHGELTVLGETPRAGRPGVSYAFARDCLMPWRNALENVAFPLELQGVRKKEREERAREMLARVGLGQFASSYRSQLSQGMRQRVALARALVSGPDLLLLDEPFAALDAQTRLIVQDELIQLLQKEQRPVTTFMITHDLGEAIALSDEVILFSRRPGIVRKVFPIPLSRPRETMALQSDPQYHLLYEEIWSCLAEDVRSEIR